MTDTNRNPGLQIAQIFVEEATFAHTPYGLQLASGTPHAAGEVNVDVEVAESTDRRDASTRLTIESKPSADALYEFRVRLVLMVRAVSGAKSLSPIEYAKEVAPATLMPFARELVANLTMRGRFGPIWLSPVNLSLAAVTTQPTPTPAKSAKTKTTRAKKKRGRR